MTRTPAPRPVSFLDESRPDLVRTALDLLAVDTRNPPGETAGAIDLVEAFLADLGIGTERIVVDPARPNLIATIPGEREETLLYNGHVDTVPFDRADWTRDPLGERDGDRIYGRGATDMKGAVAAMLETARAFAETGTTPPVTLGFAIVSDEETGGDAGLPAVLASGVLDADACVIGETTCERGRHSVTVADRGSIWLTLAATGRAAHGSRPMLGINAIDRLCDAIGACRETLSRCRLDLDPAIERIVDESVDYYAPIMGRETARRLFTHPTLNLGTIEGGSTINSVPVSARARLDVRVSPGVDPRAIVAELRECIAGHEGVAVADCRWNVGTYVGADVPVAEATARVAAEVTGERVYRRSATGGGDTKALRNAGIPTVEFGLGTDTAHADDEYTTVDALLDNARVYTRLPYELAR